MALNKYLARLDKIIAEYRDISFDQFTNLEGELATFEDLVWFYIDPNSGRKTRIVTGRHGCRGGGNAGSNKNSALPPPYGDLIKVFLIETFNKRLSANEKVAQICSARKLISNMSGDLYSQTGHNIMAIFSGNRLDRVLVFIQFCERHGLMPKISERLRRHIRDDRDRTGYAASAIRREKMADRTTIEALATIFNRTIGADHSFQNIADLNLREAIPAFMGLLCLAAPNRAAAEVPLLTNQKLQSYSEGDKAKVYFLDWAGSKGFPNNRNHVLRSLADRIEVGLSFFARECEPGRILSRYYANQRQTLRSLLGDYPVSPERKRHLTLDEQPHLFTLGYALGFYGIDDEVSIYWDIESPKQPRYNFWGWTKKRICNLNSNDHISTNASKEAARTGLYRLVNFPFTTLRAEWSAQRIVPICEVEKALLELNKKNFPSFPIGHSSGEGTVHMGSALFCLTGHQFFGLPGSSQGGPHGSSSFYTIVPPKSVARCSAFDIGAKGSLFLRHGFPPSYRLNFNQLRHFTNTYADQSGIPNEVITAWSGRKSRDQTNVYVHTRHSDRSKRILDIQSVEGDSVQPIRLISRDEIGEKLNLPASATSTGICTQNLISNPCEFLNDFISTCFLCPNSCYVAGDTQALEILDKDSAFQSRRLKEVKNDARLRVSEVMQKWFIAHTENTSILRQLISMMREHPKGTVITFNRQDHTFNLVDPKSKSIERVGYTLPNSKEKLHKLLNDDHEDRQHQTNKALQNLLTSFGIEEDK